MMMYETQDQKNNVWNAEASLFDIHGNAGR